MSPDASLVTCQEQQLAPLIRKLAEKTITPHERAVLDYLQRLRVWQMMPAALRGPAPEPPPPQPLPRSWLKKLLGWR